MREGVVPESLADWWQGGMECWDGGGPGRRAGFRSIQNKTKLKNWNREQPSIYKCVSFLLLSSSQVLYNPSQTLPAALPHAPQLPPPRHRPRGTPRHSRSAGQCWSCPGTQPASRSRGSRPWRPPCPCRRPRHRPACHHAPDTAGQCCGSAGNTGKG